VGPCPLPAVAAREAAQLKTIEALAAAIDGEPAAADGDGDGDAVLDVVAASKPAASASSTAAASR